MDASILTSSERAGEGCDMTDPKKQETYTEAETEARREAALQRMFATPHKPHEPIGKQGRGKPAPRRSPKKPD